jgi:proteasome assembly chaperone 3
MSLAEVPTISTHDAVCKKSTYVAYRYIPHIMAVQPEAQNPILTPFPARSRSKTAPILDIPTTANSLLFSDKILITLSQHGRLAHWIHVPLSPSQASDSTLSITSQINPETALLPDTHITATTILGGTIPRLDTLGQTLATSLASAIRSRSPHEGRMLVLGLGLDRKMEGVGGEEFAELVGLVLDLL